MRRIGWEEDYDFWTLLCRSSEWGVMPFHWYFSSALPRALLSALPLSFIGAILERRSRGSLLLGLSFVALYSNLGHKEVSWDVNICWIKILFSALGLHSSKIVWMEISLWLWCVTHGILYIPILNTGKDKGIRLPLWCYNVSRAMCCIPAMWMYEDVNSALLKQLFATCILGSCEFMEPSFKYNLANDTKWPSLHAPLFDPRIILVFVGLTEVETCLGKSGKLSIWYLDFTAAITFCHIITVFDNGTDSISMDPGAFSVPCAPIVQLPCSSCSSADLSQSSQVDHLENSTLCSAVFSGSHSAGFCSLPVGLSQQLSGWLCIAQSTWNGRLFKYMVEPWRKRRRQDCITRISSACWRVASYDWCITIWGARSPMAVLEGVFYQIIIIIIRSQSVLNCKSVMSRLSDVMWLLDSHVDHKGDIFLMYYAAPPYII